MGMVRGEVKAIGDGEGSFLEAATDINDEKLPPLLLLPHSTTQKRNQ